MSGALDDVVVLELATGVAGGYTGRLLSDLGAQVIKVEPPDGDPLRQEPPIVGDESAFFNWMAAGKRSAQLALDDSRLDSLLAHADIVIHSDRGAAADELDRRARAANSAAVVLSLTPWGRSGDRSTWQATELVEYATGGYHYFCGDPAREPLALQGHQAGYHAGAHATFGALAAMWHARGTGEGQCIELSHQEAMLNDHAWLVTMWTHTGQVQRRAGSMFAPCADGFVYLFTLVPYPNLFALIERFDLLEDEELQVPATWQERFPEVFEAFCEWTKDRSKQEIYEAAQELRIAVSPVNTMADLPASPQLAAREWFREIEADGRRFTAPGFAFHPSVTPCERPATAPALGEHTDEVLGAGFAWANATAGRQQPPARGGDGHGPLAGVRVIEATANWAGPHAGRLLADAGAEVIKVELQTKPATRALMYTGGDVWPNHYHRSGYFNKHNRNKKDVCLDLSQPDGKQAFLDLVKDADVVLENNAARVMAQLGLAFDTLVQHNPRIVMCSMSGYGATGPERNYSAYGSNIETASGLASVVGYGPGEYFGTGTFYADPVTGNHGAVAIMAALHYARRTGQGQWIDMALLESVIPFFAQPFLQYATTGELPEPRGNRSLTLSPQDLYQTAGTDCWLALSVRDDADFAALCSVIGAGDLAAENTGLESRRANSERINAAIRGWAAEVDHVSAANELQAAGVPAAPVMPNWEVISDNHLHDRGFFQVIRHPVAGTHFFPGFPWRFEKTPTSVRRPAPLFAEHNREVFCDILGMSEDQVRRLYDEGVTGDEPIYAAGPQL